MILRQVLLTAGTVEMITWVPDEPMLMVNARLTLKGDETEWTVKVLYGKVESQDINRTWKVGGL